MSRLVELEEKYPKSPTKEFILSCDCVDTGYLRISWEDDFPEYRYLWITHALGLKSFRHRIRDAWNVLLGRPLDTGEVILDPVSTDALITFLQESSDEQAEVQD